MKHIVRSLIISFFFAISTSVSAQTLDDFRTIGSGNWSDPLIWERYNGTAWIPSIVAPTNGANVITVRSPHVVSIINYTIDQAVVEAGATVNQTGLVVLNNGPGNDLEVNGTWTINTYTRLYGLGAIMVINGTFNFLNGLVGEYNSTLFTVSVSSNGTLNWGSSSGKVVERAQILNQGTMNWTGGTIEVNQTVATDTCRIINNGTWAMNSSSALNIYGQTNTHIINGPSGIINKSGTGTFTTQQVTNTINLGTINVIDGVFSTNNQNAVFHNYDEINVVSPGEFLAAWNVNLYDNSTLTGNGNFNITGAVKAINGTVTAGSNLAVNLNGGNLAGAGIFVVNGTMNWSNGVIGGPNYIYNGLSRTVISNAAVLNLNGANNKTIERGQLSNNGTVNWNAGSFVTNQTVGTDTCKFINNGHLNIGAGNLNMYGESNTYFVNAPSGVINKNTTGTVTTQQVTNFINQGTLNVGNGIFSTNNQNAVFHNYSTINITVPGEFLAAWNVNLYNNTEIIGNGYFTITGVVKTISGEARAQKVKLTGGYLVGAGLFIVNDTMNWTNGTIGGPNYIHNGLSRTQLSSSCILNMTGSNDKILERAQLTNFGIINWNGGHLFTHQTVGNDTCKLINRGKWNINPGSGDCYGQSYAFFVNEVGGEMIKNSGTITTMQSNASFLNRGTVKGIGTLVLHSNSVYSNSGTISPGLSPGKLTINDRNPLSSQSNLHIELDNTSGAGIGHDLLERNSNLTLTGKLTVVENNSMPVGTYTIINLTSGAISGNFDSLVLPPFYTIGTTTNTVFVKKATIYNTAIFDTICDGQTYQFDNKTLSTSGVYKDSLLAIDGGDSIVTLNLHVEKVVAAVTQNTNVLTAGPAGYQYQWISCPSFATINNATNQTYTASQNGFYAVIVTSPRGCKDTSICIEVVGLGLPSYVGSLPIGIFPNPANEYFFIDSKLNDLQNAGIVFTDLLGREYSLVTEFENNRLKVNTTTLPAGIYFCSIVTQEKIYSQKVQIVR